jgi:hypothetical protein
MIKTNFPRWSYAIPLSTLLLAASASCVRESWDETCLDVRSVPIPVRIDWSRSGINTANERTTEAVDRVSIRFFPLDGSPAFDRYLDTDVIEGTIDVPPGRYAVVVFNESIYDEAWWDGRIRFADTESYAGFAAHAVPYDEALREQRFPHYRHRQGERIAVEPLPLASWSLDELEVTPQTPVRAAESGALSRIVMRPLTHRADIEVRVENLASAHSIHGARQGFASTVYMASGRTADPSTGLFTLNGRRYESDGPNGTVHASFLTFGRTPPPESYRLEMDVLLMDGRWYTDPGPPPFDVTGQVTASGEDPDIAIRLGLTLPRVAGGIAVDEWKEQEGEYLME